MAQKYSLTVVNESTMDGDFCIFQQLPDVNLPSIVTLAWLTKRAHPNSSVTFEWTTDYNFVWSEQGELRPGIRFNASQTVADADLQNYNLTAFDKIGGAYTFAKPSKGPRTGSLYITQGPDVVPHEAHVGIGMSGAGTFVVPSQPNMELIFTPRPKYYVVFGDYEQGEVIDITQISQAIAVEFKGVSDMSVTLNRQNLWQ